MPTVLRISDATSIGLHAILLLAAQRGRRLSTHEIAAALRVSEAHLSKVLQRLAHAGFVKGTRGPHGGFTLAADSGRLTLLDAYEALEGRLRPSGCLLVSPICGGKDCIFGDLLKKVNGQVRRRLANVGLSTLAGMHRGQ